MSTEDPYGGFNDYDHAYDLDNVYNDKEFLQAVARSSHGRRPVTGQRPIGFATGLAPPTSLGRMPTTLGTGLRSSIGTRKGEIARPMTAVRAAGYTSGGRKSTFEGIQAVAMDKKVDLARQKMLKLESQTFELLKESIFATFEGIQAVAMDKKVDLARQKMLKLESQTFELLKESIFAYEQKNFKVALEKAKEAGRKEREAAKQREQHKLGDVYADMTFAVLNNLAQQYMANGMLNDALNTYHVIVKEPMYANAGRLKDGPGPDPAVSGKASVQGSEQRRSCAGATRKQMGERTILTAAKMISPRIASSFSDGYAWCVEAIKQSVYSSLAIELEINKAADLLKQGDVEAAVEALVAFNNKESKVGSAVANNLALINYYKGKSKHAEAAQFADQALSLDRYNSNALVNRGNIYHSMGDVKSAQQCYREALQVESGCVQALYNLGILAKEQGSFEEALQIFYKLQVMLKDDPQVICQLAAIYEAVEDTAQAIELYSTLDDDLDPSMAVKLGKVLDAEGDKAGAFTAFYNSYRMFPADIEVIEWMGAYYLDTQFPDKAVNYFEKAALLEPENIKWQLLMASCQRRTGNFQKALELYKQIHRKFPTNVECLKFLVQLCRDLRMPEEKDYARKLKKLEDTHRLRAQRETDSSQGKRRAINSAQSLTVSSPGNRPDSRTVSSRASIRTSQSARQLLEGSDEFHVSKRELDSADLSYKDPVGPLPSRPKTGAKRETNVDEYFDDVDIFEDDLLPEGE
uniref:Intraflagellar transport 88 n=1 Tax=Panagrolaimus sp. JU765 TaxID=591449 RepID=A0AC34QRK3_9BILA